MLILALESSAVAASAAVMEDGRLLGESYVNTRLTPVSYTHLTLPTKA